MIRYTARAIEEIKTKPGCWSYEKIGVFRVDGEKEEKVGEYTRNYHGFMRTFYHFRLNGKDLALYSPEYTASRIMELPSCKDLGGEKPDGFGFCPVEFFVPSYILRELTFPDGKTTTYAVNEPDPEDLAPTKESKLISDGVVFRPFGFVSGCIWGDDTSWKIEFLDLSEADKGILKREARFGYIELPRELDLKEAIQINDDEEVRYITIASESSYEFKTGKKDGDGDEPE